MAKVLIVGENRTQLGFPAVFRLLRSLGIDYEFAHGWNLAGVVSTPAGEFAPASNDLRNYFKGFDAVLVFDRQSWSSAFGARVSIPWLQWNNPDDPPIAYLNWHFSTAVTQYNGQFPSDFPLIRIDPSDLANTAALVEGGAQLTRDVWVRHGTPVYLHREDATVYVPTFTASDHANPERLAYWRYNPTLHSTLASQSYTHAVAENGRAGELIATPASVPPDTYPSNTVIGYRYRNRFLLPGVRSAFFLVKRHAETIFLDVFWVLYALKLCRVQPGWVVPLQFETDHPLELRANSANLTDLMKAQLKRDNFDWLRGFCRETGLVVINGVQTAWRERGPTNTASHWGVINHSNQQIRDVFLQAHEILVAGHREGTLMNGVHNHSINDTRGYGARREMANLIRHSDAGSQYGAPNDVPIQHGRCCVAKHVAPSSVPSGAIETTIGDDTILEWDFTGRTSGTGSTIATMPMQNVHAARVVLEGEMYEMRAMGFPDGHCGEHRYTNTAANNAGGIAWWQAAKELGFKALRSSYCCNEHSNPTIPGANNQTVPISRVWNGFHLLPHSGMDIAGSGEPSTWGLYDPNAGATDRHAVGWFGLDSASNDITGQWSTNRQTASWRAHQRALCRLTGMWLSINVVNLGAAYIHPAWSWYGCSLSQPLARFDGENILNANDQPHWNPTVELLENMRVIVSVLSDYLKFGSVSDLIVVRERVIE